MITRVKREKKEIERIGQGESARLSKRVCEIRFNDERKAATCSP
jgi:hypothetical protein